MFSVDDLQDGKKRAVLKVRAKVFNSARCWFNSHGFTEVQGPTLMPATGERPNHFEVNYFEEKACLAQGLHPYTYGFVASLGNVYTVAPTFRAEKTRSSRHLTEYWRIETAAPNNTLDDIVKVQEELLSHVCSHLSKEAQKELAFLGRNIEDLAAVKPQFPRITYDRAIEVLQEAGFEVFWGEPLRWELEKALSFQFSQPFFVTDFPVSGERLLYKANVECPELTFTADLLAPQGYGEIGGGGQMIWDKKVILKKMAEAEIDSADQQWFMNLRQLGTCPYSGFTIGIERFIQWLCKLEHIKEATAFPRLPDSIYP
jgi:asparaginyl-tRNA synthetase